MVSQVPIDIVVKVLGIILTVFMGMAALIAWFVKVLHNDMKKSITDIHMDLKPLTIQVALHEEKLTEIKDEQKELNKWVGNHDGRLQNIERKIYAT